MKFFGIETQPTSHPSVNSSSSLEFYSGPVQPRSWGFPLLSLPVVCLFQGQVPRTPQTPPQLSIQEMKMQIGMAQRQKALFLHPALTRDRCFIQEMTGCEYRMLHCSWSSVGCTLSETSQGQTCTWLIEQSCFSEKCSQSSGSVEMLSLFQEDRLAVGHGALTPSPQSWACLQMSIQKFKTKGIPSSDYILALNS